MTKLSFHVVPSCSSWEPLVYVANATWHHLPPGWELMIKLASSTLASSSHCILLLLCAGLFQEVCVSQTSSWVWLTRLGSHEGSSRRKQGGIGGCIWVEWKDILRSQVVNLNKNVPFFFRCRVLTTVGVMLQLSHDKDIGHLTRLSELVLSFSALKVKTDKRDEKDKRHHRFTKWILAFFIL